jgi:glycogen debranching enzyme
MVMFDHADEHGAIPDSINDRTITWNWSKPPVHGWTLLELMKQPALADPARLKEIYRPLSAWTRWWLDHRDSDGDGVSDYHHGNDSGWDNSTIFDVGCPVEGADLTAFLAVQTRALAEVASRLGRRDDAAEWKRTGDKLLELLLAHNWRGNRFVSPRSGDHAVADGDSLIDWMPLVLGSALPRSVLRPLVAGLTEPGRFVTDWGCATESLWSRFYEYNSYWRGPIWAPPMMILCDGLARAGEAALARDLAARFCRSCAASGSAENFDPKTGAGLCDRAYTWTASVFLLLANRLLKS